MHGTCASIVMKKFIIIWSLITTFCFAKTLENFFQSSTPYHVKITREQESFEGDVTFEKKEQWWTFQQDDQYVLWIKDGSIYFIDPQLQQAQQWGTSDLEEISPFFAEFNEFFYADILPNDLKGTIIKRQGHHTMTLTKLDQDRMHLVCHNDLDNLEIVVEFKRQQTSLISKSKKSAQLKKFELPDNYEVLM